VTWLGLRLALAGGRRSAVIAAITTAAVAVGTALLLLALSVAPAIQHRADRTAWRELATGPGAPGRPVPTTTIATRTDTYRGTSIRVVDLAGSGPGAPRPPGLAVLPGPGEVFVSPALRQRIRTEPELAGRYGSVAGTVGDEALSGPDELLAVRGVPAADGAVTGWPVPAFAREGQALELEGSLRLLLLLGGMAMLTPVALFIAIATRLTAATRDRRLAALRLAGATKAQVGRLAVLEALVVSAAGAVTGIALFFAVRPLASHVGYDAGRWFAADLDPGLPLFGLVLAAVPLVAVVAARVTLRRVAVSPLGVSRRVAPKRVRAWRLVPLLASVPLIGIALASDAASEPVGGRGMLVAGSFVVLLLTLVFAGPWFARAVGLLLARSGGPARLLAGRRLADDPRAGFRAIAGTILAILVTTMFVASTPAAVASLESTKITGQRAGSAQADVLYTDRARSLALLRDIRAVAGVGAATPVYETLIQSGSDPARVWIGDCAEIVRAAQLTGVPCGRAPVIVAANRRSMLTGAPPAIDVGSLPPATVSTDGLAPPVPPRPLPTETATMPAQTGIDVPGFIVAPASIGLHVTGLRPTTILVRYGDGPALERVRSLVLQQAPGSQVSTRDSTYDGYSRDVRRLYRVLTIATLGVFLVAGAGLVVALAIGLLDRQRPFALLRAAGTPLRTLRRAVLLEAAAPLAATSVVSAALGGLVGLWIAGAGGAAPPVPWADLTLPVAAGFLGSLAVVACALPVVRRITGNESTRFE
jgi:hypothetical protein